MWNRYLGEEATIDPGIAPLGGGDGRSWDRYVGTLGDGGDDGRSWNGYLAGWWRRRAILEWALWVVVATSGDPGIGTLASLANCVGTRSVRSSLGWSGTSERLLSGIVGELRVGSFETLESLGALSCLWEMGCEVMIDDGKFSKPGWARIMISERRFAFASSTAITFGTCFV